MKTKYLITKGSLIRLSIIPTLIIIFIICYIYAHYYNNKCDCKSDCKCKNNKKENFTPRIRNMYRPYVRDVRIISEGFYNDNNNKINNLFRRFGLY